MCERIKIYTAKPPALMRRGQDGCCQTMSAAEVAPGKTALLVTAAQSPIQSDQIKPRGRQFLGEGPRIGNIGNITGGLESHCAQHAGRKK